MCKILHQGKYGLDIELFCWDPIEQHHRDIASSSSFWNEPRSLPTRWKGVHKTGKDLCKVVRYFSPAIQDGTFRGSAKIRPGTSLQKLGTMIRFGLREFHLLPQRLVAQLSQCVRSYSGENKSVRWTSTCTKHIYMSCFVRGPGNVRTFSDRCLREVRPDAWTL